MKKARVFLAAALLLLLFAAGSAQAQSAYIEDIKGTKSRGQAAVVIRDGFQRPLDLDSPLLDNDVVVLKDLNATVKIHLKSGASVALYNNSHVNNQLMISGDKTLTVTDRLFAWLRRVIKNNESQTVTAATRGTRCANVDTNRPEKFDVPASHATVRLVAGTRDLFVPWRGGLPPFQLALVNLDTGKAVAQASHVSGCEAVFSGVALVPGSYELLLTDAKNAALRIGSITVVKASEALAEPAELQDSDLPQEARAHFHAVWLASEANGVWTLEAIQAARQWADKSPAVRKWLNQWGGGE